MGRNEGSYTAGTAGPKDGWLALRALGPGTFCWVLGAGCWMVLWYYRFSRQKGRKSGSAQGFR